MALEELKRRREIWGRKIILQEFYIKEYFSRIDENLSPGSRNLEIGGGSGLYKECTKNIISSDIRPSRSTRFPIRVHLLPKKS